MKQETIRNVALAICSTDNEFVCGNPCSACLDTAKAAITAHIEALEYPSDEIWEAFRALSAIRDGEWTTWDGDFGNFAATWQAMLRASLEETE